MTRSLLFLPLLALASCQTQTELSDTWGALPIVDQVEVEYRGSLRSSASDSVKIPEFDYVEITESQAPATWMIESAVLSLSAEAAMRLVGDSALSDGSLVAKIVEREALGETMTALLESGDAEVLNSPKVVVYDGQRATITVANQTAFVEHFEFRRAKSALLVDPEIDVFMDGFLMDVVTRELEGGESAQVDFGITVAELLEMREVEAEYGWGGTSVTMQVPVFVRQDVRGQWRVQQDQAIVMPVLYGPDGSRLLVVMSIDQIDPEELKANAEAAAQAEAAEVDRIRLEDGR